MAETTTTTTSTTKADTDTTTTTQPVHTDPAPTGDKASVNHPGGAASPLAERQGEVKVDKGAKTDVTGTDTTSDRSSQDQDADTQAENIEQAKQDGLRASKLDQENQPTEPGHDQDSNKGRRE